MYRDILKMAVILDIEGLQRESIDSVWWKPTSCVDHDKNRINLTTVNVSVLKSWQLAVFVMQGSTNCFHINAFSCVIMPGLAFRANLLLLLDLVWRMVPSKSWPCIQLVTSKGLDLRLVEHVLRKWLFSLKLKSGFFNV